MFNKKPKEENSLLKFELECHKKAANKWREMFNDLSARHECNLKETTELYKELCKQNKTIPFSIYYSERLEYWKKNFPLKPVKPYIEYEFINGRKIVQEFNNIEDMHDEFDNRGGETTIGDSVFFTSDAILHTPFIGHPSPYTDAEIEAWAKAKVEEEMQGWKVVKDDPVSDYKRALDNTCRTYMCTEDQVTASKPPLSFCPFIEMINCYWTPTTGLVKIDLSKPMSAKSIPYSY